ncbi:uncharacterized protein LOC105845062 [Hydra vulgaris]|uniref:uncharacterized protein LOC105845062 n=1 Tax=Hydra vulgaris TaxID=6087 RepID=UPI001F5F57E0|nr:uncharacterized protein LOC105845062 [Hydra vulgaris]
MKRLEVINIIEEVGTNNANLQAILKTEMEKKLTNNKLSDDINDVELSEKIRLFIQKFRIKYAKHSRNFEGLIKQEEHWLECDNKDTNPESTLKGGRPEKKWAEYSLRTKRRKVSSLAKIHTTEELSEAVILHAKSSPGKSYLGKKIKLLSENKNETNQSDKHQPIMMSADQALSLKIHCDLSDLQCQMIRNSSLVQNANIYPPLKTILESKADCYPKDLLITETSANCNLQNMVNHTLSRILKLNFELLQNLDKTVTHGVF